MSATAGDCCAAGSPSSLCRRWVKSGKAQNEQMLSGLPPIADMRDGAGLPTRAISGLMQWSDLFALARKLSDSLVERDVSLFDHGLPFFRLGREQRGQLFRRRADGHHADVIEVCLDGRIAQGGDRINVDLF